MTAPLVLQIAGDVRMALLPDLRHISTYIFLEQEDWFEDEAAFIRRVAEPGGLMLDIGASFGFYGLNYARAAGAGARVWAFEPTPEVCRFLRESVRLNDFTNFTLVETAVGAESGRSRLKAGPASELNAIDAMQGNLEVALTPLDALDRDHGFGEVDFVKLDVEGHELAVITGGKEFFNRESPLVMLEVKAGSVVDFSAAERFESLGYSLYRLVPQLGALVPFERAPVDPFLLNIFACKPDRAAHLAGRGLLCADRVGPAPVATVEDVATSLHRIPAFAGQTAFFDGLLARMAPDDPVLLLLRYELASRDNSLVVSERRAALEQAAAVARQLISMQPGVAQILSAARVLRGWGERGLAASALVGLLPAVLQGTGLSINAPFVPPLPCYDIWAADLANWVSASIVEAAALWSTYSSYWGEPTTVPVSEVLFRFGRQTAPFERRRQLRRIVEGRQSGPEAHPLLKSKSPDNLNPAFWVGGTS